MFFAISCRQFLEKRCAGWTNLENMSRLPSLLRSLAFLVLWEEFVPSLAQTVTPEAYVETLTDLIVPFPVPVRRTSILFGFYQRIAFSNEPCTTGVSIQNGNPFGNCYFASECSARNGTGTRACAEGTIKHFCWCYLYDLFLLRLWNLLPVQ